MPRMTVNERPLEFLMDAQTPLLWALRDAANLTGTKFGCGTGDCHACTVHIDGQALRSCLVTLGEAEGRFITTVEGLNREGLHPVQEALVATQAIQCGFCTPGIVMAAAALLRVNNRPTRSEVEAALPNLCRCGVYPRLVEAVRQAAASMGGGIATAAPLPVPAELTDDTDTADDQAASADEVLAEPDQ